MHKGRLSVLSATLTALLIFAAGSFHYTFGQTGWSQNISPLPTPTGMVNDYTGVIDEGTKQGLETKLRAFKEKTGVELAVAVVRTTGDRDIFDYSMAVARGWGIGSKADDNPGALLFVAIDDRKYFTQISKDLEDEMPDGVAGSLQRQFLVPEFKKQNYAKGISDTLDAYIFTIEKSLSGSPPAPQSPVSENEDSATFSTFCCLAVILFIVLLVWSNRSSKGGGGRGSGSGDGLASALPWIIMSGIGNSSSGGSSWSGGGSGWGSSGGSSWGGFGGGGDFGGGGAGGGW
jgi:uncharacterized protein